MNTHALVMTTHAFSAYPHFLAHQALCQAQCLLFPDNPVLYSCLIFQSAFLSSYFSDTSSQHLNQICRWVIVSSLLCGNHREDRALRAKGISLSTSPSYIKSFLSFRRTALQHKSSSADVLFRVESQAPPHHEKLKCRLWEQQSLGHVCVGVQSCALYPGPRSTLCSFSEGSFLPQCSAYTVLC